MLGNNNNLSNEKNSNGSANNSNGGVSSASASQLDISTGGTQQQPNTVLRVIIDNMLYPVALDVLYTVIF